MPESFLPSSLERPALAGTVDIASDLAESLKQKIKSIEGLRTLLTQGAQGNVSAFLDILLLATLHLDASDVHLEPERQDTKIRFRIDGILQEAGSLSHQFYRTLLSRLKLASGVKLNVTDRPQDGRFSFVLEGQAPIEARTATLPSEYGESMVLRVLNPQNLIELSSLGLRPDLLDQFRRIIKRPDGMILASGPTGCGKTTTLYAFLKEIQHPEIKIITIEDPIEYHLEGISQTQVHPEKGYDFATGLQAIMRQDPDVLLVGEMRDKETAEIALQAALTGHLVLSTIHANNATGTVSRLLSLGAKPINAAAALALIISQRLVRRVCPKCSKSLSARPVEIQKITRELSTIKEILKPRILKNLTLPNAQGCAACNLTGYKGRTGIFESIEVDDEMEQYILTSPSVSALRQFAIGRGMITLYQDGLLKVLEGITTLQELDRVAAQE